MDPFQQIQSLIEALTDKLTFLVPIFGGCALVFLCLQYIAAGDSHEKSEMKRYMKGTVLIVAIAMVASAGINWFAGQLG